MKLYSNNCPKCKILKKELDSRNINYELISDIDEMKSKYVISLPTLELNGNLLTFKEALDYARRN